MFLVKYFSSQPTGSQTIKQEEVEEKIDADADDRSSNEEEEDFKDAEEELNQQEPAVHDTFEASWGTDEELQSQERQLSPAPGLEQPKKKFKARKSVGNSRRSSTKVTDIGDEDFMGDGGVVGSSEDGILEHEAIHSTPLAKRTRTSRQRSSLEDQVLEEAHESPILTAPRGHRLSTEDLYQMEADEVLEDQRKVDGTYLTKKQVEYRFPHSPSVFDHGGPNRKVKVNKPPKANPSTVQLDVATGPTIKSKASTTSSQNTHLPSPRESDSQEERSTSAQQNRNVDFAPIRPLLNTHSQGRPSSVKPQKKTASPSMGEMPLSARLTSAIKPPNRPILPNGAITQSYPQVKAQSRILPATKNAYSSVRADSHAHHQPVTPAPIRPTLRRQSLSQDSAPTSAQPQRQTSSGDEEAPVVPRYSAKATGKQRVKQDASEAEEVLEPARMSAKALGKRKASDLITYSSKKQKRKNSSASPNLMMFGFTNSTTTSENGQYLSSPFQDLGEAASRMYAAGEDDGVDLDPEDGPASESYAEDVEEAQYETPAQQFGGYEDNETTSNKPKRGRVHSSQSLFVARTQQHKPAPTPSFTPINAKSSISKSIPTPRVEIRSAPRPDKVIVFDDTSEAESTESDQDIYLESVSKIASSSNEQEDSENSPSTKKRSKKKTPSRKRSFTLTEDEVDSIYEAVQSWQSMHDLSDFEINELVAANGRDSGNHHKMWAFVMREVGGIQKRKVHDIARRKFTNCIRGPFTTEEDEELKFLYQRNPDSWKVIGALMNRLGEDCRHRWRNYVMCADTRKVDVWSIDEEKQLKEVVEEALSQIEEFKVLTRKDSNKDAEDLINWKVISEKMGRTRSRKQCIVKWKALKDRFAEGEDTSAEKPIQMAAWRSKQAVVEIQELAPSDKLNMLYAIRDSGAGQETKIPWLSVQRDAFGVLGKVPAMKLAFRNMKERVQEYQEMSFKAVVQELIDAYETSAPKEPRQFKFSKRSFHEQKQDRPRRSTTAVANEDNGEGSSKPRGSVRRDSGHGPSESRILPPSKIDRRPSTVPSHNSADLVKNARGLSSRGREKERMKLTEVGKTDRDDDASSMPQSRRKLKDKMKEQGQQLSQESQIVVQGEESLSTAFETAKNGKRKASSDLTSPKAKKPLVMPRRATRKSFLSKERVESGDEEDDRVPENGQEEVDDGMEMQLDEPVRAPDSSTDSDIDDEEEDHLCELETRHVIPNPFVKVETREDLGDEEPDQEDEENENHGQQEDEDDGMSEIEENHEQDQDPEMAEAATYTDGEEGSFGSHHDTASVDLDAPTPMPADDGSPYYDENEQRHEYQDRDEAGSVDLDSPTKPSLQEEMDNDDASEADDSSSDQKSGPSIASYELSTQHADGDHMSMDHSSADSSDMESSGYDQNSPSRVANSSAAKYQTQALPDVDSDDYSSEDEDDRAGHDLSNQAVKVKHEHSSSESESESDSDAGSSANDPEMPGYQISPVQVTSYDGASEAQPNIFDQPAELEFSTFDVEDDDEEFESSGYPALYLDAVEMEDDVDVESSDGEESVESDSSSDMSSIPP